jgi:hypothetical protein
MSRRHTEPIRKNHKLTENRRRRSATHSVFFKKRKTSSRIQPTNQQIRVRTIYRDVPDIERKHNLQSKRNRTKRASMLVAATLAAVALSSVFTRKGGRK